LAGIALAVVLMVLVTASAPARAGVSCAMTIDPSQPSTPTTGDPSQSCWTDVTPYPFGSDGNPVTPGSAGAPLPVLSLAFRAWNRGLAAVQAVNGVPYTVWLFNGSRWYPDPTFPGPTVCTGQTILWAGKLDYWLVGGQYNPNTGAAGICRFDGVNFEWDPIPIPAASLSRVPVSFQPRFTLHAGACYAWDNCWFFGDYGVVDHWDGQTLSDASAGLGNSPWLQGGYTAASAGVDSAGDPSGLAVSQASANGDGVALPSEPDGSPAPQVYSSFGGAFAPLLSNPLVPSPASSALPTDLVAVAADRSGGGWVAGDPVGARPKNQNPEPRTNAGPAPLFPVSASGAAAPCSGWEPGDFGFEQSGTGPSSWLWQTLSIFPGSGAALAGGQIVPPGEDPNSQRQPVLVTARCGQSPVTVGFSVSAASPSVPADVNGYVTAVAANADNDAWAATTAGSAPSNPPHLYRLTDGRPPDAPAGDDDETRPLVFQFDPTIYVQSPGVVPPPPATVTTVAQRTTVTKRVKAKPAIYDVKAGKPVVGRGGRITLTILFKVRTPVTVGLQGLRGHTVVSSSGLRHFGPGKGHLALVLDRKRWPTRLKFIIPKQGKGSTDVAAPVELTWTARIPPA
jgi:hypothetical protein